MVGDKKPEITKYCCWCGDYPLGECDVPNCKACREEYENGICKGCCSDIEYAEWQYEKSQEVMP